MKAFTKALQKGMDFCKENSAEEISKVIAPQFEETPQETITAIVTRYHEQDTWKENLIFEESAFVLLQDILREAGQLEEEVPYAELVTTDFAKSVAK